MAKCFLIGCVGQQSSAGAGLPLAAIVIHRRCSSVAIVTMRSNLIEFDNREAKGEETVGTRAGLHGSCTPCSVVLDQRCCKLGAAACFGNLAAIRRQSSGVSRRSETVVGTRAGLHNCSFTPDSQGRGPVVRRVGMNNQARGTAQSGLLSVQETAPQQIERKRARKL